MALRPGKKSIEERIRQGRAEALKRQEIEKRLEPLKPAPGFDKRLSQNLEAVKDPKAESVPIIPEPYAYYQPKSFVDIVRHQLAGEVPRDADFEPTSIAGRHVPRLYDVSPEMDNYESLRVAPALAVAEMLDRHAAIPEYLRLNETPLPVSQFSGDAAYMPKTKAISFGQLRHMPGVWRSGDTPAGFMRLEGVPGLTYNPEDVYAISSVQKMADTMMHEVTHGAQYQDPDYRQVTRSFADEYIPRFKVPRNPVVGTAMEDYWFDPEEIGARGVAEHFSRKAISKVPRLFVGQEQYGREAFDPEVLNQKLGFLTNIFEKR